MANGLKQISAEYGASSLGALVSPHATLEELHLSVKLMQGLGSNNIDHRLRHAEFAAAEGVRYLGTSIASLSELQSVLVVGSNLRKEHPLFAQRIRQSARKGCVVSAIASGHDDWAMPVAHRMSVAGRRSGCKPWRLSLLPLLPKRACQAPVAGVTNDERRCHRPGLAGR